MVGCITVADDAYLGSYSVLEGDVTLEAGQIILGGSFNRSSEEASLSG